ncbi:peptidoglycan-binding domain-containing protein [Bacillus suaedaesalsae]|uniref:Peptidoglycan-binding protein n=1 Tax=Bacillus suaedaesalsae TaxID=2810349 RepID=A0ABS2DIM9_9BACI|nr:peptidoglycan-binding protein [Bacillus suaedaesalsae]
MDGIYGPLIQNAVITRQQNIRELEVTGYVDPDTWMSLGFQCEVRPKLAQYIVRPGILSMKL